MTVRCLSKFLAVAVLLGVLAFLPAPASADTIWGTLNITGSVAVGATTIDWFPLGGGTGTFKVEPTSTGSFAPLADTSGTAKDLDVITEPVGSPFSLMDFLTFSAMPSWHFDLMYIDPGVFGSADCAAAPAAGQTCTPLAPPPKSPFNLANTVSGSTASFVVRGTAYDDMGGPVSMFTGIYTTQFATPYQSLLQTVARGGTVQTSYSATYTFTTVPEPATWSLVISGLLFAAGAQIRRFRRS